MDFTLMTLFLVLLKQLASGVPLDTMASVEIDPFIVGGVEAPEGFAPHMMALVFGERLFSLVCGASCISDRYALTAAHCIDAVMNWDGTLMSSVRGVYGSNRWNTTEKSVKFTHYKNHEDWDSFEIKNDIGVLCMERRLTFSKTVAPISLEFNFVGAEVKCYVTGWGREWAWGPIPDKLQLIYVKTISEQKCDEGVREAAGGWWAPPVDQRVEVCTLHPKKEGHGMCNGDSGGALVCNISYEGTQVGIVSWGFPCARGAPDMFTRVSAYKDWLSKHLHQTEVV